MIKKFYTQIWCFVLVKSMDVKQNRSKTPTKWMIHEKEEKKFSYKIYKLILNIYIK